MAKKSKKRRAWTATEVRELKTLAKKKTAAARIGKRRSASDCRSTPVPEFFSATKLSIFDRAGCHSSGALPRGRIVGAPSRCGDPPAAALLYPIRKDIRAAAA